MHDPAPLGRPATSPVMAAWTPEVRRFFGRYRRAFDARHAAHVAQLYSLPSLAVTDAGVTTFTTRAEITRYAEAALADFAALGYHHATCPAPAVRILGYELTVADVEWTIHARDGRALFRFAGRYHLTRRPGAWRIMVVDTSVSRAARSAR